MDLEFTMTSKVWGIDLMALGSWVEVGEKQIGTDKCGEFRFFSCFVTFYPF